MIDQDAVQRLCVQHEDQLRALAQQVSKRLSWDLSLPVGVIDARTGSHKFHTVGAGGVGNVVRMSTAIDHPLMKRLFDLIPDRGDEAAVEELINDEEVGEEFAQVFSDYQKERKGKAPLWGSDDATAFVTKSRTAFEDDELAVVALLPGSPHKILTFGIPWRHYLK